MWSWLERPDNRLRLARFGAAMNGVKNATPPTAILEGSTILCFIHFTLEISIPVGYGWEHLPEGSLVVDVGGGVGSQSLTLASHHPHLRFVVQDREFVVGDAVDVCAMDQIKIWRMLMVFDVLDTALEEEHARRARIWPREDPR